jgi:peptide-methionine (S)-S-oxide reductase
MHTQRIILVAALVLAGGYVWLRGGFVGVFEGEVSPRTDAVVQDSTDPGVAPDGTVPAAAEGLATATLAAGCFWCVEADFDKLEGVVVTISGYTGGSVAAPMYSQVSRGGTGHTEAVQVIYDPAVVSYDAILAHYWRNVDPFVAHRQFCDVGPQYRPEIFFHSDAQREAAEASKARLQERFDGQVMVAVSPAGPFYRAEEYHQDYYQKNPVQYRYYRWGCGRDTRLSEIWTAAVDG